MTMKFTTCCWLLIALAGTNALAQTRPKHKPVRKHAVMRRQLTTGVGEHPYIESVHCYLPLEEVETVEIPECSKVYTYVEQMPTLNGQNAIIASTAAIRQRLVVPLDAPAGRIFAKFEVNCEGWVTHPQILKGLRSDLDTAVVKAIRQLPRFSPGKQNGRLVNVSITIPITIPAAK